MKMKNQWIITTLLLSTTLTEVSAQSNKTKSGDLHRQLEVTRAYEPTVREAAKLDIRPNMVDTVALRPELLYSITPDPVSYGFKISPISAARVNVNEYTRLPPVYIKLGGGYPTQSVMDFYYNAPGQRHGRLGAYINHYGYWSKIKNDNHVNAPATHTFNKAGLMGERYLGRYSLIGEFGGDYDLLTRYDYFSERNPKASSFDMADLGLRQKFSTLRGRVGFGDSFRDLSHFNFRFDLEGDYFSDYFNNAQSDLKASLDLGKAFRPKAHYGVPIYGLTSQHELTLHTDYAMYKGEGQLSSYGNNLLTVAPLYRFKSEQFDIALGGDFTLEQLNDQSDQYFFPRAKFQMDLTSGYFVPYGEIEGRLISNDYRSTTLHNPYVMPSTLLPNTSEYNGRVGILGRFGIGFSYKLYGGWSRYNDYIAYFSYHVMGEPRYFNHFEPMVHEQVDMLTFGADFQTQLSQPFALEGSVQYCGYSVKGFDFVSGLPNLTGHLELRYTLQQKVILSLGGRAIGPRDYYMHAPAPFVYTQKSLDWVVDLSFGAEYRISKTFGLFLQGNNLANQQLYPYWHYPGLGINAMIGVKFTL